VNAAARIDEGAMVIATNMACWAQRRVALRLAALALTLGSLGIAHAAVYVGAWDPAFGFTYGDLGWNGSVTVFVPDSCDQAGTSGTVDVFNAVSNPATPNCDGNAIVDSAQVTLYSLTDTTVTDTLDFTGLTISELEFVGGSLTGIATDLSSFVPTSNGFVPAVLNGQSSDFALQFGFHGAILTASQTVCTGGDEDGGDRGRHKDRGKHRGDDRGNDRYRRFGDDGGNDRHHRSGDDDGGDDGGSTCRTTLIRNDPALTPVVTYAAVPEPASAALTAVALLAGGFVRRRRVQRPGRST
jgi:hypothetical protein